MSLQNAWDEFLGNSNVGGVPKYLEFFEDGREFVDQRGSHCFLKDRAHRMFTLSLITT